MLISMEYNNLTIKLLQKKTPVLILALFKGGATAISITQHLNRSRLNKSNQLIMELINLNVTANMIPGVKFTDQFFNI
jgi:hypothetical protein